MLGAVACCIHATFPNCAALCCEHCHLTRGLQGTTTTAHLRRRRPMTPLSPTPTPPHDPAVPFAAHSPLAGTASGRSGPRASCSVRSTRISLRHTRRSARYTSTASKMPPRRWSTTTRRSRCSRQRWGPTTRSWVRQRHCPNFETSRCLVSFGLHLAPPPRRRVRACPSRQL